MTDDKVIRILEELWRYSKTDNYTDDEIREALDVVITLTKDYMEYLKNAYDVGYQCGYTDARCEIDVEEE